MLANQLKIKECRRTCKGPKSTVSECNMDLHNNAFDGHQSKCKKMLGCFKPNLGQIWTNPNVGLKNAITKFTSFQKSES